MQTGKPRHDAVCVKPTQEQNTRNARAALRERLRFEGAVGLAVRNHLTTVRVEGIVERHRRIQPGLIVRVASMYPFGGGLEAGSLWLLPGAIGHVCRPDDLAQEHERGVIR